jgi:hypothetical protein
VESSGVASRKRPQREPTDDWPQVRLAVVWPEQHADELIRPVVAFGQLSAERAQQTGVRQSMIDRKTARFEALGIVGLVEAEPQEERRQLLPSRRASILLAHCRDFVTPRRRCAMPYGRLVLYRAATGAGHRMSDAVPLVPSASRRHDTSSQRVWFGLPTQPTPAYDWSGQP